jgi:hypothetical protein
VTSSHITKWIIPISGFSQNKTRTTGIDRLWLKVRGHADGNASVLPPQVWNSDWKSVARWIWSMSSHDFRPEIYVFSYSYGCGHGFSKLSRCLGNYGLTVDCAVLSDPVYRSWYRPWRSILPRKYTPSIVIEANVKEVFIFRQSLNIPQGADIVKTDKSKTFIHEPVELQYRHAGMDDTLEFHSRCESVLEAS